MTSRLKRRLEEIGVNPTSKKASENFCLIGTPLPPLEKSRDTGEFVPLWKQEVRDEKGRRRLHGAFTGGFSAGYFNTVGSKEGWAPSTFVSSRNDRTKAKAARPEDFMDEEDLQDLKDSQNLVDTTDQMDFLGGTQAELQGTAQDDGDKDPITQSLQAAMMPAPKDSVGARILKRMGWRLGQGIGPRISLKQRKLQDAQAYDALTGAKLQGSSLDIAQDDEEASKHKYPRRDTPVLIVKKKDNSHGLGYVPGMSLGESLGENNADPSKGPKLAGGFGLGALNDADEDDLDVYDHDAQDNRRRQLAYDNAGEDDEMVVIGQKSNKQKAPTVSDSKPSSAQYFRDGRLVLPGFVISEEPVAHDQWFPVPEIPKGWTPDPRRVWAADKENIQHPTVPAQPQSHDQWKKSKISAEQRGTILGETPLPGPPRSVFDYMSQKDKERIKNIAAGLKSGPSSTDNDATVPAPSISITRLETHIAQAALNGFQPFTNNPVKQARYTAYLQSQATPDGSSPPLSRLADQTVEEFNKEIGDYAKSASLFRPISGAMAGRFTSAAVVEFAPQINEGLHMPTEEELAAQEAQRKKEEEEKISPKEHAAKMGMYGSLTRETKPWQPARLLCKRFRVKDPNPEPEISQSSTAGPSFTHAEHSSTAPVAMDVTVPVQKSDATRDLNNIGLGEDETQGQDTLTYQRPPMDIFKAIFASDDEDSDSDEKPAGEDDESDTVKSASKEKSAGFTSATSILDDTPIDPETFKPKFIPREDKAKKSKEDKKSKEKKDKKKKDKKAVLVSFEIDEDGGDSIEVKQAKDRPKKKRKEQKDHKAEDEHAMFSAEVTESSLTQPKSASTPILAEPRTTESTIAAGLKGRKRAIDFM